MPNGEKDAALINLKEALTFTCGDHDTLIEISRVFLDEGPRQMQAVRESINAGDADGIRKAAHALKGSVVIFGASEVAEAANEVQNAGKDQDLAGAELAAQALEQSMKRLVSEVTALCEGPS